MQERTLEKRVRLSRWRSRILALLIGVLLASCSIESAPNIAEPPTGSSARPFVVTPSTAGESRGVAASTQDRLFLVDKLVRSSQIEGIDLHVRYVEQTPAGVVVHLSLYNNRGEDLAYVSGADAHAAQLIGARSYKVTATSESLANGIDPGGGWLNGGATVGTLTFGGAQGRAFTLLFPGFPDVEINLDQPITSAPEPPPPPLGTYTYDFEAASSKLEHIGLRVEQAQLEADALLLTIAFINRNDTDITFSSTVDGSAAVLFDGLWRQYRPSQVDQSLAKGIQPQGAVWGEDEANRGTLTFPRPRSGDVVLLQFPSYPLIRIPLRTGEPASLATEADLPPSSAPRPTPTPAPTPTPLSGEALARSEVADTLVALTKALAAGDRAAYLVGFAPELRSAQGEIFERAVKLPLTDIKFEPVDDGSGTFSNNATQLSDYDVDLSYHVRDVDPDNIFSSTLRLTLQQQDGRWLITAIDGKLPFWAYGPTEATRSGAFWIFYRPELAEELPEIEQEAQRAFEVVDQALPNRAQPVNVMHVTATEAEFTELTERSGARFLGVASARYRIKKAGIQITSRSFYINGAAFTTDPAQDRQKTIAHELTHLVLAPKTMPYTPAWISEGAAMYVTRDFPQQALTQWYREGGPQKLSLAELSAKTSFGELDPSGEQTSIDYAYSAYLVRYIVETYGEDAFFGLYDSLADVPFEAISDQLPRVGDGSIFNSSMGDLAQKLTPEKVRATLGVDLETLEANFEEWLGQQVGG